MREGSLEAPQRHPVDWKSSEFNDEQSLFAELERVFDICHGCRRCFNLCNSFPTLFDAIDESDTFELDGVDKEKYWDVVGNCYLCDLCFMTKCPYVPPHEWEVDFPHLMLRAKIVGYNQGRYGLRNKILADPERLGKISSVPVLFNAVNLANRNKLARGVLEKTLGVHKDAGLPEFCSSSVSRKLSKHPSLQVEPKSAGDTNGKVALFSTCYGKYNKPDMVADMIAVFEYNNIPVKVVQGDQCCGMPKLELGDMESVEQLKNRNMPILASLIEDGWDIVTPIPSCTLMFKQEFPLLFDEPEVRTVGNGVFDPFEYLMLRHKHGLLNTGFKNSLGSVLYHAACHQRVQYMGAKTKDVLNLTPDINLTVVERCSGHDGNYAIKSEYHEHSKKIVRPIVRQLDTVKPDHLASDCVLAASHIANCSTHDIQPEHPITLLKTAYGI